MVKQTKSVTYKKTVNPSYARGDKDYTVVKLTGMTDPEIGSGHSKSDIDNYISKHRDVAVTIK